MSPEGEIQEEIQDTHHCHVSEENQDTHLCRVSRTFCKASADNGNGLADILD